MRHHAVPTLFAAACLFLTPAAFAEDTEIELPVGERPTFGLLQKKGVKFLITKDKSGARRGVEAPPVWAVERLEPESTSVVFQRDGAKSKPLPLSLVHFNKEDFKSPGEYYPPEPALGEDTPIDRVLLWTDQLSAEEASEVLESLAPICNFESRKFTAWFEARLWEATPHLELRGELPSGSAHVYVTKSGQKESGPVFSVRLNIIWNRPAKEKDGAAIPTAKALPEPPTKKEPKRVILPHRQ